MEDRKILKQRLYFFVPYNISPIQQAIQAGHAALEYAWKYPVTHEYVDFMTNDKTWIILNGGTTNEHVDKLGTLNQIYITLLEHDALYAARNESDKMIRFATFNEPDLNDALTAVVFLADERVWDYETYPEFYNWFKTQRAFPYAEKRAEEGKSVDSNTDIEFLKRTTPEAQKELFPKEYIMWTDEVLGGEKTEFLRNLIRGKKLA